MGKSKTSFDQVIKDMNNQMALQDQGGLQANQGVQATVSSVFTLLIIFILIAVGMGALLALLLARHISRKEHYFVGSNCSLLYYLSIPRRPLL